MMMSRLAGIAGLVSLSLIACGGSEEKAADAKQPVTAAAPNNTTKDDTTDDKAAPDGAGAATTPTDPAAQTNTPPAADEGAEEEPPAEEGPDAATCKATLKNGIRFEKDDMPKDGCEMLCLQNGAESCEWNGAPLELDGDVGPTPEPGGGRCEGELSNGATFWTEGGSKSQCVSACEKKQKANTKVTVTCTYDGENVFGG